MEKKKINTLELWENFKRYNTHVTGVPKEQKIEQKKYMNNSLKFSKINDICLSTDLGSSEYKIRYKQKQNKQKTSTGVDAPVVMHYSKYRKPKAKRKFWNKVEEKHTSSTRKKIRHTAHSLSKTMQTREEWSDILSVQSNIHQSRILHIQKVTLQMWKKNKCHPGQKLGST